MPGVFLRTKFRFALASEALHPQLQSISGLVAENIVAIDVSPVRFPADASLVRNVTMLSNRRRENPATGDRNLVARKGLLFSVTLAFAICRAHCSEVKRAI